jgi:DNA-directed RNA polymerase alpha subunit
MTRDDIIEIALMGEQSIKQRIEWAVDMERKECAKLCFQMWSKWLDSKDRGEFTRPDAEDCAAAIRERHGSVVIGEVDRLELTMRSANCLRGAKIFTIAQLLECTENELLAIPNLGKGSLKEIIEVLKIRGLRLKEKMSLPQKEISEFAMQRAMTAFTSRQAGMTYKEIGKLFNIGVVRARQLVIRGKRFLDKKEKNA